jgi:hypothetical protein
MIIELQIRKHIKGSSRLLTDTGYYRSLAL